MRESLFPIEAHAREKLVLAEDTTTLKKLDEISRQDSSHKEAELLKIQQELQQTVALVKEKEHTSHLLETQVSHSSQ